MKNCFLIFNKINLSKCVYGAALTLQNDVKIKILENTILNLYLRSSRKNVMLDMQVL